MNIIFNLMNTGLGNNGGSHTLVKSANELKKIGHNVLFIDTGKINYTWSKIECDHLIIKNENQIPNADVIIGTGSKTFSSTSKSKIKKKYLWIRGWEIWNTNNFANLIKEANCHNIVNSISLKKKLENYNIHSDVIMPGYDFELLYPMNIRKNNKNIILGGLFNIGKKRENKRVSWIFKVYEELKNQYNINLIMYGSDGSPKNNLCNIFYKNPDDKTKNYLYNICDIWLAPTCLEGLHIPPAEAGLTECCVVGTNCELNGMHDYLIHNKTGLLSKNNYDNFKKTIINAINNKDLRLNMGKNLKDTIIDIGTRKQNMIKFINLMEKYG